MTLPKCRWCGGAPHAGEWCPLVAGIEYEHEDGKPRVIKVEFHPPTPPAFQNAQPCYCGLYDPTFCANVQCPRRIKA